MHIEIANFRGVESALIDVGPVLSIIGGPNGAGKSSVCQAVAAALLQTPAPIAGMKKGEARSLLREGAKRGYCSVGSSASSTVNWPGGSVKASAGAPIATTYAAGVASVADMAAKQSASELMQYAGAIPRKEDLDEFLQNQGVTSTDLATTVWNEIESHGWDAAHKRAQESGARLKGRWEEVTGENWGEKKAAEWMPDPLVGENEIPDKASAEEQAKQARSELERALQNQAVSADERARLEERAGKLDQLTTDAKALDEKLQAAIRDVEAAQATLDSLPRPESRPTEPPPKQECPHCSGELRVAQGRIVDAAQAEAPDYDEEANRQRAEKIEQARKELQEHQHRRDSLQRELEAAEHARDAAEQARDQLAKMPDGGSDEEEIARLRAKVEHAESVVAMFSDMEKAHKLSASVTVNQKIVAALAPTGVRQVVLQRKLSEFNDRLAKIAGAAGWPAPVVTDSLGIEFGGRPYALLSKSEQWRVRLVLQLVMARIDRSSMVVIDEADILDRQGRNGLVAAVRAADVPALVAMTMDSSENLPKLKPAMGGVYWLENAHSRRLN